ncbi:MAG: hypothetical protein H0Z22_05670 [Thermosipho sp. (in: Bacteria)]|nr:hypothetical protein [Thermosipho sp. (in: thermotogales)]
MNKILKSSKVIFKYGAFSLPFVNYLLKNSSSNIWNSFFLTLKYSWKGDYKKAIHKIDSAVKNCSSKTVKYFFLANKLSFLKNIGQIDSKLYKYLKRELPRMSKAARNSVMNILINIEASGFEPVRHIRLWGNRCELNNTTLAFLHLAQARRHANQGKLSSATHHYIQAYWLSKKIPHPSGIVSSLNDLAWDIRNVHPFLAYSISQKATFWLGYYRETPGNLFGTLDTLFVIEENLHLLSISHTAKIITTLSYPEKYVKLFEKSKKLVPNYNISSYKNTKELREYLRNIIKSYRKENVSIRGLYEILSGKTNKIRGNTLKKIIIGKELNIKSHFPIYNELLKMELRKNFNKAIKEIENMYLLDRKKLFITTYMSQLKRKKFYLSRKDKFMEAYESLKNIEKFKRLMAKKYTTMEFAVDMVKAHPYIEGRKLVVGKALNRMGIKSLEKFIQIYIEFDENERKLIDRFLRNYGRYEGINFETKVKGPECVKVFARKFQLKVQPTFLAYWCEEDGRVRRKLERILKMITSSEL